MLMSHFAILILIINGLSGYNISRNPWMYSQRIHGPQIPPKPPEKDDLHDFLPKCSGTVPSLKTLQLTILSETFVCGAVTGLTLATNKGYNRVLWKH